MGAALWMAWVHRGRLTANSIADYIEINADVFKSIVLEAKPGSAACEFATRYGASFVQFECPSDQICFQRSDLWGSNEDLAGLANEAYNTVKNQFPNDARFASERSQRSQRSGRQSLNRASSARSASSLV